MSRSSFDESLADKLYKSPTEYLPIFEESATELADEVTAPRPDGEEKVEKIQVNDNMFQNVKQKTAREVPKLQSKKL